MNLKIDEFKIHYLFTLQSTRCDHDLLLTLIS